jgi:hypothetical protein
MADNTRGGSQDGSDPLIATDEVTYSGDTADVQLVRVVGVTGSEGSKTVVDPTLPVSGDVAHDIADSGNPVKIGGKASNAPPADVADGDRVDAWFQRNGAQTVALADGAGIEATIDSGSGGLVVLPLDGAGNAITINGSGSLEVAQTAALPAGTNNIGDVDIASSVVLTTKQAASTGTLANVASSASSVTLMASNASRLGATIHNDSTQVLYVKFGTTASATSYTVKMVADAYYEVPFGYTGRIDGIWASANGNARITEMT